MEFFVSEQGGYCRWCLLRKATLCIGAWREGECAMCKHLAGECGGCSLDSKVAEHGVRFPASK